MGCGASDPVKIIEENPDENNIVPNNNMENDGNNENNQNNENNDDQSSLHHP